MKKGFTLVELLVVISIISLLSSVVLASLNTAREKARIAAGQQFSSSVNHGIGDQLVLSLNFDGNVNDGSGYNNVVSAGSGIYETGISNQAVKLSPSSVIVVNSNTLFDSADFTISLWIKPNSINTTWGGLSRR